MQIEKVYEPQRFEPHWAQWWIDSGIFRAAGTSAARSFSLVIPPPNVTGSLHIGHMLEHTEIDVTTRWHRMRADNEKQPASRWFAGAGINRHVRLLVMNDVHLEQWATFVTTPKPTAAEATVRVQTTVVNQSNARAPN